MSAIIAPSPALADARRCEAGTVPARYARNANTLSPAGQARLLRSTALLVGLGGLGGWLLEMLARMGVGHIIGVDGDSFEESNGNRQLLATQATLGKSKAAAAANRVAEINPAIYFEPVSAFVRGQEFAPLMQRADIVADALGGLDDRAALYAAASATGKTVVGAGIAGLSGWVAVVRPGEDSPLHSLFGEKHIVQTARIPKETLDNPAPMPAPEEILGNLAPTVAYAASLQCIEIVKILIQGAKQGSGQESCEKGLGDALRGILLFDMQRHDLVRVM